MTQSEIYGAPDPPDVLLARGVLHPRVLSVEVEDVIRQILLARGVGLSMFEIYAALVVREVMVFDPEATLYRDHPTIKGIAGACQYLHFSGQLQELGL